MIYFICFATSSAKFSSFFSRPSPVSNLTKPLIVMFALFAFAAGVYLHQAVNPAPAKQAADKQGQAQPTPHGFRPGKHQRNQ